MLRLFLLGLLATADALLLPSPEGPYQVGLKIHAMTDHSRVDPYSPADNRHPRRLLTSIFWPVAKSCSHKEVAYLPPATAAWYGTQVSGLGLPNNTFSDMKLDVCDVAKPVKKCRNGTHQRFPLAIFSSGAGNSRLMYSLMAMSLASEGYVVVTVDHPYDADLVEFPDGMIIKSANISEDTESLKKLTQVRAADLSYVVSDLKRTSSLPAGVRESIDFSKLVAYGHSLGGASAASVIKADSQFLGGVDLDGRLVDPVLSEGIEEPFLLLGRPNHRQEDDTWVQFWKSLRGPKAELALNGTLHGSYTDMPRLFDALNLPAEAKAQAASLIGAIDGERLGKILTSTLSSFFSLVLGGSSEEFSNMIKTFAEVSVINEEL
ncbi:unnamed protein product [Clonostachys rhizophaga]|uniref:1-alkyl-2-acetylglycerophosphocholine esterase n=1 Tax=Clonostachys rhizophaga TaxID=160324 RepID=A0A9N9YT94_9HYPO|nr:unnamed protein product [Clonostachys rhizophaga]